MIKFAFTKDVEGFTEIVEIEKDGSSILWDVRFPTERDAKLAIETYKRRLKCSESWGLVA
jgi:hypothetical protein